MSAERKPGIKKVVETAGRSVAVLAVLASVGCSSSYPVKEEGPYYTIYRKDPHTLVVAGKGDYNVREYNALRGVANIDRKCELLGVAIDRNTDFTVTTSAENCDPVRNSEPADRLLPEVKAETPDYIVSQPAPQVVRVEGKGNVFVKRGNAESGSSSISQLCSVQGATTRDGVVIYLTTREDNCLSQE